MIIVAGALKVDPDERDAYLEGCVSVVEAARRADGCLDFALSPDLLDPGRINVYERGARTRTCSDFAGPARTAASWPRCWRSMSASTPLATETYRG